MNASDMYETEGVGRSSSRLLDVLIRAGIIGALVVVCYQALSPFLTLLVWSIILAVTMYPFHAWLTRRVGGRQWLASTLLVVTGIVLIVAPTALLMNSFADSVRGFVAGLQDNSLAIPPPREGVENWPVIGKTVFDFWSQAHADLGGVIERMQPKIGELVPAALGVVARIGGTILLFVASFIVASIIAAYGDSGAETTRAIFVRVAGPLRGEALTRLSTATIRAVALGVIGVATVQAILVGLAMLGAGVPGAGVLAIIVLVLGIAQVPAIVVTLPVIVYIWASGDYSTGSAVTHTIILLLTGMADNVLKPMMLGRGVDVPMPVILLGALGGMASGGILGMFVGAIALALGYEIFMGWVAAPIPDEPAAQADVKVSAG